MYKNPTSIVVASINCNTSVATEHFAINRRGKSGADNFSIANL
jgi:hypothetical protein